MTKLWYLNSRAGPLNRLPIEILGFEDWNLSERYLPVRPYRHAYVGTSIKSQKILAIFNSLITMCNPTLAPTLKFPVSAFHLLVLLLSSPYQSTPTVRPLSRLLSIYSFYSLRRVGAVAEM
ncbi:hypothetical protein ACTXT7_008538 [Hymenolepis weldensis]